MSVAVVARNVEGPRFGARPAHTCGRSVQEYVAPASGVLRGRSGARPKSPGKGRAGARHVGCNHRGMRTLLAVVLLLLVTGITDVARADGETTMVIRNHGSRPVRVQVSLGPVLPCDSHDDTMVLDTYVGAGEERVLGLGIAAVACARSTSPGSALDWGPSLWLTGGYRCRSRRPCVRDPSVLMRFDVGG